MATREMVGAIHLHTTYSDGSDSVEAVAKAAAARGLDYVIIADHNTLAARDRWEGYLDGVLIAFGVEVTPRRPPRPHILALGMKQYERLDLRSQEEQLAGIAAENADAYIPHPTGHSKIQFGVRVTPWDGDRLEGITGVEIWSYMHDWITDLSLRRFHRFYAHPHDHITGPTGEVLAFWDEIGRSRRFAGIAALDNHARNVPFRRCSFYLAKIFPHEMLIGALTTHAFCDFTGNAADDIPRLYAALREGRSFMAFDALADARGFRFEGTRDGAPVSMGDEVTGKLLLETSAPRDCALRLLRTGEEVAATEEREIAYTATEPGVYRVEARIDDRPWVFTNPIYLREEA